MNLLNSANGMDIFGQGRKIIIVTLPSILFSVLMQIYLPNAVSLPGNHAAYVPLGIALLSAGLLLWIVGMAQLLIQFPKGKLITDGAYAVCRNPIYASYGVFILPAIALLTGIWAYFLAAISLVIATLLFIGKEEEELQKIFGKDYEIYAANVNRIMPFFKFRRGSK